MHSTHQSEPIQPTPQRQNLAEQVSTNPRRTFERFFERTTSVKQPNWNSTQKDTYISDIVNVQSLLNIRKAESEQHKRQCSKTFQDRIIINVCGDRYETHRTTLELYPDTLLGNRKRRKYYYDKSRNEYFFDRNRACFEAILYYYQSHGRLRRPNYVSIDIFLEEVIFFQLGQEALDQLRKDENIKEVKKVLLPKNRFRRHIWATMEYPDYSIMAKFVNIFSLLLILISTLALAVESLPEYVNMEEAICEKEKQKFDAISLNNTNATNNHIFICHGQFKSPFFIIQSVCVGFFTIELILRMISAPSLLIYIKSVMNWVDILAVIPYYFILVINLTGQQNAIYTAAYVGFRFLRILRFIRVFKFYRVFKNVKSLRVLAATFKQSIPDFFIMIIILTLLSFLFGAAAYFAENETNSQAFDSILKATYWGIMTITSVGYGDISPITPLGRIISCLCALFGAATIGMLVSVLVDRYQRVFARKLYVNEETVDFNDHSDDENCDSDSRGSSRRLHRCNNSKAIQDPDARSKNNVAFEPDDNKTETIEMTPPSNIQIVPENPIVQLSDRVYFIIGYVDNENHATSRELIDTISAVVALKQTTSENIQLNIVSDGQQRRLSSYDVKFNLSMSSDDDTEDDENEELTEIVTGCGNKGNVLKKFQAPPSPQG